MLDDLPQKFGDMFANKQLEILSRTCQFHIGCTPEGKVVFDVNGANPELVAKGFVAFREALKKVKLIV